MVHACLCFMLCAQSQPGALHLSVSLCNRSEDSDVCVAEGQTLVCVFLSVTCPAICSPLTLICVEHNSSHWVAEGKLLVCGGGSSHFVISGGVHYLGAGVGEGMFGVSSWWEQNVSGAPRISGSRCRLEGREVVAFRLPLLSG